MNICFVSHEYPEETGWGGIGTYTYEIAHGLARLGHKVVVVSRALSKEQVYEEDDEVTVYRVLPKLRLSNVRLFWRINRFWEGYQISVALLLNKIVRKHKINIIETPSINGETFFFQYFYRRLPVVMRLHSATIQDIISNGMKFSGALRINHWFERHAVPLAKGITAPSKSAVRENLSYLPIQENKVSIIPNPLNTDFFTPGYKNETIQEPLVLFVGRVELLKGAHILGQAIPAVCKYFPNANFIFAGSDGLAPDGGSMIQWILNCLPHNLQHRVKFTGNLFRKQLLTFYQKATVFVRASLTEIFGYSCIEAMSCAKPVIASKVGGLEEIIEHNKTGFLITPKDPEALADKIIELLSNKELCHSVGNAARERVLSTYASEIVSKQMEEFYNSVL
ncbi:MAG: glycosyltransferase family 4 protein [Candidatus Omnitrophica bacterium]|nr:glycosyltransferase family 4 protein [Candidatus Omnitrophota bacterium]